MSRGLAALALASVILPAPRARAQTGELPPAGAWLEYHYEEVLTEGTGEYQGYTESTVADARYTVLSVDAREATIRGAYTWTYRSPDRTESRSEDRTVAFSVVDRRYTSDRSDSSDYDDRDARELATWIWIPPSTPVGEHLRILDGDFAVVRRDARVTTRGGAERVAIEVHGAATGRRDDDYGHLSTRTDDRYFFDAETGMFLREEVREHDQGSLHAMAAAFTMVTTIEVVDASYAPAIPGYVPPPPEVPLPEGLDGRESSGAAPWLPCFFALAAVAVIYAIVRARRGLGRAPATTAQGRRFTVEKVADAAGLALPAGLSRVYDPFLVHFATIAQKAGNPVALARRDDGTVIGLAFGDRETDVGTVFADDSDVCEGLRRAIGHSEFFSTIRHPRLASVARTGTASPEHAYNVYETYEVLTTSSRPEDLGYDRDVVTRMVAADRDGVIALLRTAYGVPCERWLDAALAAGDLAWVARQDGKIVGLAMASLCGRSAHLHALTVGETARGRGLGTALMRARLRALFDLGATTIVSECATWNLAAREVASRHGLTKAGDMYVESSDAAREQRKIVRR